MVKLLIIEEETGNKKYINFKSEGTFYELASKIRNENFKLPKYFFLLSDGNKLSTKGKIKFYENQKIKIRDPESLESLGGIALYFNDVTCGNIDLIPVSNNNDIPEWREVCNGINLIGLCENQNCKAYNQEVYAQIHDDNYSITENNCQMKCPICKNICLSKNVAFYNCYYNVYGVKYDNNKDTIEKFGVQIPNFSNAVINDNDSVNVNGKKIKVNKTELGNASYCSTDNGNIQYIKLNLQVKKFE